ncbi:unnamed protein product [Onchocerca flexuosa]|uniref:Uncharacterized protein n=1 Tax=Onchocerca flexuosa TaxID=387005 RepID=A0A183I7D6_9BILA|nr:unnamed protein product [Onchocerca flexuosa]
MEMLQIDLSNAEAVSAACVYLADPHKLPIPTKDANANVSEEESNMNNEISQHNLDDEKINEQNQLCEQYQMDDMSISSDSDFEETLQNHFQYTPKKSKSDEKIQKNDSSSIVFTSPVAFNTENPKSNASFSEKENFSPNVTGNINVNSNRILNSEGRKRRITNSHFDASSPVEQFCESSLVASTPMSVKPDNARQRRLAMVNSAIRTKMNQSKQRTLLNLSVSSTDSMNTSSPLSPKDEARKREQGAIAKHIARIRTSTSRIGSSNETSPLVNSTSRYYSMRTSFGSNDSSNFSKLSPRC